MAAVPGAFRFRDGGELACGCGASRNSSCCGLNGIWGNIGGCVRIGGEVAEEVAFGTRLEEDEELDP